MPLGETAFLTFRLHGTIPTATARELKAAPTQAQQAGTDHHRARKQLFAALDVVLDRALIGPCYFDDEKVAEVLAGEIMMLAETGFTIHGFGILPNHAHFMLRLPARSGLSFAKALKLLHVRTGKHCRRLVRPKLPPEAAFWQPGWLKIPLLDATELVRAQAYVRGNARQAGLPARFQAWPYVNEE